MFWIYSVLILISGGSGIGFLIHERNIEAIIAFVICTIFIVLLYFHLKRNDEHRNCDCSTLACTDYTDCNC
ncbi:MULTISPECIES: hypothetical protein [Bacillus]|uniref:Uncharacterized protein n=1 Tax=Bacillus cereus HuA4-10 TaxID=1053206 RepID=J8DLH7_BACCE|nr:MULTISPECIES: hypothetical protein [Bacillus]EJQ77035.1 hypothetical protein IGC_03334 [Bacillus cereus HuA4-10]QWG33387.1 hypothetical protein EXW30_10825 [Bacillus mycoides]UYX54527.1 hypothetical protein M3Y14_10535 [Bacillus thuringiensis]